MWEPQIIIASSKRPIYKIPPNGHSSISNLRLFPPCAHHLSSLTMIMILQSPTSSKLPMVTLLPSPPPRFSLLLQTPAPCVAAASSSAVGGARASRFLRAASLRRSRYFSFSHSLRSLERRECSVFCWLVDGDIISRLYSRYNLDCIYLYRRL